MAESASEIVARLSERELRLVAAARDLGAGEHDLNKVAARAGLQSADEAYSAASWLQTKGLVRLLELPRRTISLGPEGKKFLKDDFPERRVLQYIKGMPGPVSVAALLDQGFLKDDLDIALAWWKRKGFGTLEKTPRGVAFRVADEIPNSEDEEALRLVGASPLVSILDLEQRYPSGLKLLQSRPGILDLRTTKNRLMALTDVGVEVARAVGGIEAGIAELTPELVKSGAWKSKTLRAYDLSTPVPRTMAGKPHPLVQIIQQVRQIFVELGFREIETEYVQSAFWNMDALFIPQDHPAREMQDTFYLAEPGTLEVPDALIEKISKVHKSGAGTGSRGWGFPLDPKESRHALLRTHTTVNTIRYLADHPDPVTRVFSIGRVFRKETMDATHLPEFHQIEGIATEPGADFRMLLGILQEFYRRLGFEKLRWRPAYFPYTEPSMEVEVWTGKKWMELGGCGIFRPEVTLPFGVKTPVLAWGLGLERLAMMRLGLTDIRDLYISDLEWLRSQPLL